MCKKLLIIEIMPSLIPENYVNISETAKSYGKILNDWANRSVGQKAINEFTRLNPFIDNPLITKRGRGGGTYAHPELAAIFKVWCDPQFAGEQQMTIQNQATAINFQSHVIEKQAEVIKFQRTEYQKLLTFLPDRVIQEQIASGDNRTLSAAHDGGNSAVVSKWAEKWSRDPLTSSALKQLYEHQGNIHPEKYEGNRSKYAQQTKLWGKFDNLISDLCGCNIGKESMPPSKVIDRLKNLL